MSIPFRLQDREIQFLATFFKHVNAAAVDMDAVSADMQINKKHAQTLKSTIKKKTSVYLDGTNTASSSAGVRKPSAPSTKRGNAGAGRGGARRGRGRPRRASGMTKTGNTGDSNQDEVVILDNDDEENPFMEPKPAQPIETELVAISSENEDESNQNHAGKTPEAAEKDCPLLSTEAPTEQVDEEHGKETQQIVAWEQDVIDWDARNAGLY